MRAPRFPRIVAVCTIPALVFLALPAASLAGTYYVSPGGNDTNPGTAAAPWRTVSKAAAALAAGDTAIFKAGTYNESLMPARSGTAGSPITFRSETPRGAILDGQNSRSDGVNVYSTPVSHIRIDGFEIRNFTNSAVIVNDWYNARTSDIQVVNCYAHDVGGDAMNFRNSKGSLIEDCEIANTGMSAIAIGGQYNSTDLVIRGNDIHHIYQDGIKGGSVNLLIEHNNLYDSYWSPAHQDALELDGYTNCTVRYNTIGDFTQLVYGGIGSGASGHCDGLYVYGNVLYNSQYWARQRGGCPGVFIGTIGVNSGTTFTRTWIYNNTFLYLGDGQKAIMLYGDSGVTMDDVRVYNNIFYQCRGTGGGNSCDIDSRFTNVKADYNCYYNISSIAGQDAHSIKVNPQLVNYTQGASAFDVHLKDGSPCIGAGAPALASLVSLPVPYLDMDGCVLPVGGKYDIGAYARSSQAGTLAGDLTGDGHVDVLDVLTFVNVFGTSSGNSGFDPACDFDRDGTVGVTDLLILVADFGR